MKKRIACCVCTAALNADNGDNKHPLMMRKDRGGLVKASQCGVGLFHIHAESDMR